MKDHLFTGRDVPEALTAASRALGLPESALRYVVLEREAPGTLGRSPTPARIAVLLDGPPPPGRPLPPPAPADPRSGIRRVVEAVEAAAGRDLGVVLEDGPEALTVRVSGAGSGWLVEAGGEAARALEHLLQRMFNRALAPRRLSLECEGLREKREESLRQLAREMAEAVRADGQPRTTQPLNSYERRIVHVAIGEQAGVRTYSVGEGADRRVTVAPAETSGSEPGPPVE